MRGTDHKAPRYVVLSTPGLSCTRAILAEFRFVRAEKQGYTDFSALLLTSHHSVTTKRIHLIPYKLERPTGITWPEQKP
jgi:hypothetical protein